MQTHGYVVIRKQKILVLVRGKKYSRTFKLRISGTNGQFFEDESYFLTENKMILNRLLSGEIINI